MTTADKVRESNRIEGILREPAPEEIVEHERFVSLDRVTVEELERFVGVYRPGAELRDREGMNVRVGNYTPTRGGPQISETLTMLLAQISKDMWKPHAAHVMYETLHPFTDGNGRSGRALWYWMMRNEPMVDLGFLHAFYYQTLQESR